MTEVTDSNFSNVYPIIEEALKTANFIAIDAEFTGIRSSDDVKESIFDTMHERYQSIRENIGPFVIVQFGITTLHRIPQKNEYTTNTFNFYLLPRSIPLKNRHFLWQVAAIEFLSSHKFDFNKVAYEGVSYLDEEEENLLKRWLQQNENERVVDRYNAYTNEEDLRDRCNKVSQWLANNPEYNNTIVLETVSPIFQYLTHKEIRKRFPNVWTMTSDQSVIVMKVAAPLRTSLESEEGDVLENGLLDACTGFSKVFKLLVSLKKPIIGHNALLDLMFMYQQFYRPLPKKYEVFKENIHKMFPIVYDTKYLSFMLRDMLDRQEKWRTNSLGDLYTYFKDGNGKYLILNTPYVRRDLKESTDTDIYHNAGWDSYVTGYIFLKMAHVFTVKKFGSGYEQKLLTATEIIHSMGQFVNAINIVRSNASHLVMDDLRDRCKATNVIELLDFQKLDGVDPDRGRPEWFYVNSLKSKPINVQEVAEKFSTFGHVHVTAFTKRGALVTVSNSKSAREILQHFRSNKEYSVGFYNPVRHSKPVQAILWSGIILLGGMLALAAHRSMQRSG